MSFTAIAPTTGMPVDAFSTPDLFSFCVNDDGGGGDLFINGQGVLNAQVSGALDLKTYFGSGFKSNALIQGAFAKLAAATNAAAEAQLVTKLDVQFVNCNSNPAKLPQIAAYLVIGGQGTIPFLKISGPGVAGTWRVTLQLRHTLLG